MKEELQGKLVEILTSIQTAAGKASDFALEQLPDIAQSYVVYGRMWATLVIGALLLGALIAVFVALRYGYLDREAVYKGDNQYRQGDWNEGRVFAAVAGTIAAVMLGGATVANASGFLLVWFAPKVWLLKEIAALVK